MIAFGLYLLTVLCGTSAFLGHSALLSRLTRRAYRWLTNKARRGSRITPAHARPAHRRVRPRPSWSQP